MTDNIDKEPVRCHFCGEYVKDGYSTERADGNARHWLSDCRPDLVEHPVGPCCTWAYRRDMDSSFGFVEGPDMCYAYDKDGNHVLFYPDGPMG